MEVTPQKRKELLGLQLSASIHKVVGGGKELLVLMYSCVDSSAGITELSPVDPRMFKYKGRKQGSKKHPAVRSQSGSPQHVVPTISSKAQR